MRARSVGSTVTLGVIYKGMDVDHVTFRISPTVLGDKREFGGTYREEMSVLLQKGTDKIVEASILQYGEDECFDSFSLLSNSPIDNAGEFLGEAIRLRNEEMEKDEGVER